MMSYTYPLSGQFSAWFADLCCSYQKTNANKCCLRNLQQPFACQKYSSGLALVIGPDELPCTIDVLKNNLDANSGHPVEFFSHNMFAYNNSNTRSEVS